jgi:hypothetical protein
LITQLQYVLTGGSNNRWEAHEIKNVRVMAVWFLKSAGLDCGIDNRPIREAAWRYRDDWKNQSRTDGVCYKDGGRANQGAVDTLIADLQIWCRHIR